MPVTKDLELPIKYVPISGPGVDALNAREEYNDNAQLKPNELRSSFDRVKQGLFAGIKAAIQGFPRK